MSEIDTKIIRRLQNDQQTFWIDLDSPQQHINNNYLQILLNKGWSIQGQSAGQVLMRTTDNKLLFDSTTYNANSHILFESITYTLIRQTSNKQLLND